MSIFGINAKKKKMETSIFGVHPEWVGVELLPYLAHPAGAKLNIRGLFVPFSCKMM
jgi:hypothetical protein